MMKYTIYGFLSYLIKMTLEEDLKTLLDEKLDKNNIDIKIAGSTMKSDLNNLLKHSSTPDLLIRDDYKGLFDNNFSRKFTLLGGKPWVIIINDNLCKDSDIPKTWKDLLDEKYKNSFCIQGNSNKFCGALLLNFHKNFGYEGIRSLARNTKIVTNINTMIRDIGNNNNNNLNSCPIILTSYPNAKMISKNKNQRIIWPEDGAFLTPIYTIIKDINNPITSNVIDYLTKGSFQEFLSKNDFLSINSPLNSKRFNPLSEVYINDLKTDYESHKENLNKIFREEFNGNI